MRIPYSTHIPLGQAPPKSPARAGHAWTKAECANLEAEFQSRRPVWLIARDHNRSLTAILSRMASERMLYEEEGSGYKKTYYKKTYYVNPNWFMRRELFCPYTNANDNTPIDSQPDKEIFMQVIENVVFINGKRGSDMSDLDIFGLMAKMERDIAALQAIKTKSVKLSAHLKAQKEQVIKLAEYVDNREGGE